MKAMTRIPSDVSHKVTLRHRYPIETFGGHDTPAISVEVGTKYACNNNFVGDKICLQFQLGWGLYMPATLVTIGIKYACNLGS